MSTPQPRATVRAIPAYVAGKPPVPRPGQQVYKLSSNENPYPPLRGVVEAAQAAVQQMNRYPDMGSTALYAALGERLGVPTTRLAAGTGSVAVLYHLLQAFCDPGDEVWSASDEEVTARCLDELTSLGFSDVRRELRALVKRCDANKRGAPCPFIANLGGGDD